jgi:hypothetical protein
LSVSISNYNWAKCGEVYGIYIFFLDKLLRIISNDF